MPVGMKDKSKAIGEKGMHTLLNGLDDVLGMVEAACIERAISSLVFVCSFIRLGSAWLRNLFSNTVANI